jgi:hypothetical protein
MMTCELFMNEFLVWQSSPKMYWCTYRKASGHYYTYRTEIIIGISTTAVRNMAELLLQPGEMISNLRVFYPPQMINQDVVESLAPSYN